MDSSRNSTPAADTLYEYYADLLYRLAYSQLSSAADAEDAVSDVFVKYLQSAPVFSDREHEKAWLIRVLINHCKDLHRRRSIRVYTPLEEVADLAGTDPEDSELLHAVQRLPEHNRLAVLLHYFEGFSLEETAAIQRTTVAAVKMRLMRSRSQLKSLLKGADGS